MAKIKVESQSTGTGIYTLKTGTASTNYSATLPDATGTLSTEKLTTKGDLEVYGTAPDRLAVGTNDYLLTADSTAANGVAWKAAAGGGKLIGWATDTFSSIGSTIIGDLNTTSYTPASSSSTIFMTITGVFGKQTSSAGHGLRVALKRRDSAGANEYNVHSDTSGWLDGTSVSGNKAAGAITGTSTGHTGGHAHQWVVRGGASAGGGYNWSCEDARVTIWEVSA